MQKSTHGYDLIAQVGVGAQSVVYKAQEVSTGKIVALKRVEVVPGTRNKPLRHLANEYRNGRALLKVAGLEGRPMPHLVQFHRMFSQRGLFRLQARCLVMDYVEGQTLDERADYPVPQLVDIFAQVCDALEFMHHRGFVHADLKPNNIVVDRHGQATVIDLGFSCLVGTRCSSVKGTFKYIAPEQLTGGTLTPATDVYNLGATMYRVLTGQPLPRATKGRDALGFVAGHAVKAVAAHELNPSVPRPLSLLVEECIKRQPSRRPQTASGVARRLRELTLVMALRNDPLAKAM